MNMVEMTAYCGLNCEECKAFKATRAEDIRWKEQIAKHWSDQGEIIFKPECIMASQLERLNRTS